jgi:hypothetical protein
VDGGADRERWMEGQIEVDRGTDRERVGWRHGQVGGGIEEDGIRLEVSRAGAIEEESEGWWRERILRCLPLVQSIK